MAAKSLKEKLALLDKIANGFNTEAKKTVAGRLNGDNPEIMEKLTFEFIPTPSNDVNEAMGGGFARRKTTIVTGLPDSGKTSLVLESAGREMQRDPNFILGWLESENSLSKDYMFNTLGIDPKRCFLIEHEREGAGEAALDKVEAILASGAVDMMCINSLKCLVPQEEFKKGMDKQQVGAQARMNAKMTRKYTSLVAESNAAFVIVTHLTTQIGRNRKCA